MNKRGFVFIYLLFLFPLLFAACSSGNNTSSHGVIYEESAPNEVIKGIAVPSNYIELMKMANVDLTYDISAVAEPTNAVNKKLLYSSSNEKIATVDGNGLLTIKDFGEFSVEVKSAANEGVFQHVDFYVAEKILTPVNVTNIPLSIFGQYEVKQYGVNKSPERNIGGSLTINADKLNSEILKTTLFLNGASIDLNLNSDDFSSLSYDEIAKSVIKSLNATNYNGKDADIIISLKGSSIPVLVSNGVITDNDVLKLSLKKISDINPGQSSSGSIINATKISIGEDRSFDRKDTSLFMIKPILYPNNTSNPAIKYESSNKNIATINNFGKVNILSKGQVVIKAISLENDKVFDSIKLTISDSTINVTDIKRKTNENSVLIGKTIDVSGSVLPENATFKNITYTSSNPKVAYVDSVTGKVTGKSIGNTKITALADNGRFKKEYDINVSAFSFPVTAIMNMPTMSYISMQDVITIDPVAFPPYAQDKSLKYSISSGSDVISFDEATKTIKPLNKGVAELMVTSASDSSISKTMKIYVREEQQAVEVTSITLNNPPANLYINNTTYDLVADINQDANVNTKLMIESNDNNIVSAYAKEGVDNQWQLTPVGEGEAEIRVYSTSGVEQKFNIKVHKVMNTKGYYKINKVKYSYNNITKELIPNENNETSDKMLGEFGINIEENNVIFKGRMQYTPKDAFAKESYTFNNWRFIYVEKNIPLDSNDKFAAQTKDGYKNAGLNIVNEKTIEYTYYDNGFTALFTLEKVNDAYTDIPDKTIYMTPLDINKDPKSIEGYYEMTFFYGNPYNKGLTGYQPVFSGTENDRPTTSDIGISYMENGRKCLFGITCLGGNGAGGSVTNYTGSFVVKVDGSTENAKLNMIMKTQKQGHHDYDLNSWLKYIHATFGDSSYSQNKAQSMPLIDKNLKVTVYDKGYTDAYLSYRPIGDNNMQFEMQFFSEYQFTYRAEKVSDRYVELPTTRYVEGDITGRGKPERPQQVRIEPVTDKSGSVSDIF